jgi:cation transport ATPase
MRFAVGRLSLVGPIVAVLLAAGVAGGDIDSAAVLDAPSDFLAANYDRLPFHEAGASFSSWLSETLPPRWQDAAIGITRGVWFLLFVIAAAWACIPVGGWSRLPRGAVLADILTSAAVPVTAIIAVFGLGPVAGIPMAPEFWVVAIVVLVLIAVSAVVYWLYVNDGARHQQHAVECRGRGAADRRRGRGVRRVRGGGGRAAGSWMSRSP